jgi:flavin reductase
MIATAVCSLSAEPPSVVVCVNKSASAHDIIVRQGFFGVNVLTTELAGVVAQFTQQRGAARFDGAAWHCGTTGAPLIEGSLMSLECEVARTYDGFSHTIFVGLVQSVTPGEDHRGNCLLW